MKLTAMTLFGVALCATVYAQQLDSATNDGESKIDLRLRNPSIAQPADSPSIYSPRLSPQRQQQSPIIQQKFQSQPGLQYQQRQQSQPALRLQPLQTNPQIPSQTQPLDLNNGSPSEFDKETPANSDVQRPG